MRDLEAKHPSLKRGGEFCPSCRPRYIIENKELEMRDLEAKHPSLKRGGEFCPSCRPRYNRG
jgi:hypothetical protein